MLHLGDQLGYGKGLVNEIIGPILEGLGAFVRAMGAGHDEDLQVRPRRMFAQRLADVVAVQAIQVQIE